MQRSGFFAGFITGVSFIALFIAGYALGSMKAKDAKADSGSAGGVTAVTGMLTSDNEALWVVDGAGKHIAVYGCNGRTVSLIGARKIDYDLSAAHINNSGLTVEAVRNLTQTGDAREEGN
ncbi:MAG: hypothetical protein NUW37_06095 [Planctomycetes bacterium]|nr:hypothetical protein [Planctomycetota bacterium]